MPAAPAEPSMDLVLTTVRHDTELLVHVQGRLTERTAELLVGCARSWAGDGVRSLVVDLAEGVDIDGWGVAALLRCRRVMRARAGGTRVLNAPGVAAATLRRTGMYVGPGSSARQRSGDADATGQLAAAASAVGSTAAADAGGRSA